jgi:uncharacterized protein
MNPTKQRTPKTPKRIQAILSHLAASDPLRIILFGSWARGDADDLSDIDLVVILESEEPFIERILGLGRLLPGSVGSVDLLAYTPAEFDQMIHDQNPFAEMILEEGKVIYERSSAQ